MQSKATSVEQYLAELPPERREALTAVRKVILDSLDGDLEEGMQYGMIGYFVPHRVFPAGYHCDPKQPLPYAGLASQKGHMSLYLMCVYGGVAEERWLRERWRQSGKKLDMGKACIRFKRLEDLPLDVVGELFRRVSGKQYMERYTGVLATMRRPKAKAKAKPAKAKPAKAKTKPAKAKPKAKTKP